MLKYIKTSKWYYLCFLFLTLIASLLISYQTLLMRDLVNAAVAKKSWQIILTYIATIIGMIIFATLFFVFSRKYIVTKALVHQNTRLRQDMINKINNLSNDEYAQVKKGELISWFVNDLSVLEADAFTATFSLSGAILSIIVYIYTLFNLGWQIGLLIAFVSIVCVIVPYSMKKTIAKSKKVFSNSQENFNNKVMSLISGYREFAYKNQKLLFSDFIDQQSIKLETSRSKLEKKLAYSDVTSSFVSILSQTFIVIISIVFFLLGWVEVGVILAAASFSYQFISTCSKLASSFLNIRSSQELLKKYEYVPELVEYQPKKLNFSSLAINNLNYEIAGKKIFSDLNLVIEKNKRHLLVGPSGAGKTTLFKIIFGLIHDYTGDLMINQNINYRDLDTRDIWNEIAYVPQENIIFNASLRNNLTLWNANISDDMIIEVLKKVNLSYLLDNLTLDTLLNNDSKNISGGEIQRIAIARALLQQKPVMILDEITSSLDKKNRLLIEDLIGKLDKTILYISHTASTASVNFDKVIKLSKH